MPLAIRVLWDEELVPALKEESFVRVLHDPYGNLPFAGGFVAAERGGFFLCLGSTELSDREGVSAAGSSPALRRLTPAVDAEALVLGRPVSCQALPVSPQGIVSPVVLTRACLRLLGMTTIVFDCGSFWPPRIPCLKVGASPARCVSTGAALPLSVVEGLFQSGLSFGIEYAEEHDFMLLAECVPGGTTTAMGVLAALGYEVGALVSSSLPSGDRDLRTTLIREGMSRVRLNAKNFQQMPLQAVAAFGDPMQPFVAGMAASASLRCPVILSGGSQMLAVFALLKQLVGVGAVKADLSALAVATTKWVAFDPLANSMELARLIGSPFLAACPDFNHSRQAGLQAYELGNVKEGVGAGGAMAIANICGTSPEKIMAAIDDCYDEMVATAEVG